MADDLRTRIDGFLKIPDIPGESTREGHEDEIEVHGVQFKMSAPHDPNSLSRRGRAAMSALTLTKAFDISSPYISSALWNNVLMDEVMFACRRTIDSAKSDYLKVTLKNASVVNYEIRVSETENDVLEDVVSFAFEEITITYDDDHEVTMNVGTGV